MQRPTVAIFVLVALLLWLPATTAAQGETTSAIVGHVSDATGAVVPHADVTIVNKDTGLRRNGKTDEEGYFNFPQLKPGVYSVKVEAEGFEWQQNDAVTAALGQKQTVNFTLKIAQSKQTIEIRSDAAILNPENANTATTLSAPALENLPNPGGEVRCRSGSENNWKMHLIWQVNMYDTPQVLPLPKIVNLLTDLKEERDLGAKAGWVSVPMVKILAEFQESLKKYPPIKAGTPDPYVPQR